MSEPKNLKDLKIEEELCEKLDTNVYLPVKEELKGIDRTYSLGHRKEDFKGLIEKKFKDLKQLAITHIKHRRREGREMYYSNIDEKSVIPWIKDFFGINEEDLK